jgi:HAD superfamily phosphoserine phosphatase-like hydrolase
MKKVGVFDIDGTVYRDAMSFVVAEPAIEQFGTDEEKGRLVAATQTYKERESVESYWAFNKTILKVFEDVLPRISPGALVQIIDTTLESRGKYRYAYTTGLIQRLKDEGRTLIAISGSIKDIVEPFSQANGFDIIVASGLEVVDGSFTGKRVAQTNKSKDEILKSVIEEHGLTLDDSYGIGDTHRDISMLNLVSNPIAFNPNAALFEEATANNWKIVLERKNMVYELAPNLGQYVVEQAHPTYPGEHQERDQ